MKLEFRIPLRLRSEEWIKTLEQMLLLLLILGRWMLPKGKLTHDQLSQLLLVYIGTAADIVEFFDAFKEEVVKYEPILCMSILGIWSFSLIQFSLVLTATRARRDQSGLVPAGRRKRSSKKAVGCCSADVYGIIISIMLQDAPFLVLRLLLIFKYNVLSYTNMFFTSKNTIVIVLLIYRLVVVQIEKRRESDRDAEGRDLEVDLLSSKEHGRRLTQCASLSISPSTCSSSIGGGGGGGGKSRLTQSGSSYSNGLYSRSSTPYREHSPGGLGVPGSVGGSMGSIGPVGGGGGGGSGGGGGGGKGAPVSIGGPGWNRSYTMDTLNSPV